MQLIDTDKFYTFLYYGEFAQAKEIASHLSLEELWQVMVAINHGKPTILSYGYVISLLIQEETAEYHYLASCILVEMLNAMEGAYASGFWHAQRALELSPNNVDYKQQYLKFYLLPGQLLSKDEAIDLAREVLEVDSNNQCAIDVLEDNKIAFG